MIEAVEVRPGFWVEYRQPFAAFEVVGHCSKCQAAIEAREELCATCWATLERDEELRLSYADSYM